MCMDKKKLTLFTDIIPILNNKEKINVIINTNNNKNEILYELVFTNILINTLWNMIIINRSINNKIDINNLQTILLMQKKKLLIDNYNNIILPSSNFNILELCYCNE
ncbi:hypothetical protein LbFV_ORF9 [Leptopilina boulardi filamentous virus]|uniref:Uncharacterized protein n=1 Tax=Leptopilina boulardi filamentous virus TaxID=552509 RepID=A0A1S5YCZ1_9VIRU|nr:hypothetical protein LbFV_ORF9 [Leptopilina boulardi filamentous virus]AQQ79929.1 hypothetical protein LbFV_ORF9 [Leptopilina boulardi filamentous virus]